MNTHPSLELRQVRKRFGNTEIIRGVSLQIESGQRVALIGPNGAGKSTLFNLISGRMAPTSGEILLNGQPIHGHQPYEINRRGLARSFQVSNLFPRLSVFENIRCGRQDATREQVIEAARRAHAAEFIERLPQKWETEIGERGQKLSGGERQRVAIARAILKNEGIIGGAAASAPAEA